MPKRQLGTRQGLLGVVADHPAVLGVQRDPGESVAVAARLAGDEADPFVHLGDAAIEHVTAGLACQRLYSPHIGTLRPGGRCSDGGRGRCGRVAGMSGTSQRRERPEPHARRHWTQGQPRRGHTIQLVRWVQRGDTGWTAETVTGVYLSKDDEFWHLQVDGDPVAFDRDQWERCNR